jgi:hypothetical protein
MTWHRKETNFSVYVLNSQRQQKANNYYFIQSKIAHDHISIQIIISILYYYHLLNIVVLENQHMT